MNSKPFRVGIVRGATVKGATVHHNVAAQLPASINSANDLAAQRQRYLDEGFEEGYNTGLQQGLAKAEEDNAYWEQSCRNALQALVDAAQDLRSREETSLHNVIDQTASLSLILAEQILAKEIGDMADPGRHAIARLIGELPEDGDIKIRLCPQDIETLGSIEDLLLGREVQFIPDPSLSSGSAILQAQASTVDGQLDHAIARASEELR